MASIRCLGVKAFIVEIPPMTFGSLKQARSVQQLESPMSFRSVEIPPMTFGSLKYRFRWGCDPVDARVEIPPMTFGSLKPPRGDNAGRFDGGRRRSKFPQ
jgi:hypothetical protein